MPFSSQMQKQNSEVIVLLENINLFPRSNEDNSGLSAKHGDSKIANQKIIEDNHMVVKKERLPKSDFQIKTKADIDAIISIERKTKSSSQPTCRQNPLS